ncbi:MAG: permease [Planctomycetes bacterium]|nr:permease [Planctomycetota bacterium]
MEWSKEWKILLWIIAAFVVIFFLPVGTPRFDGAAIEALQLAKWYAREHVLLCLIPAFFIAGAISVFVSQASVMRYLGPRASKPMAYGVASISGTILAVCSCTVLPLFSGIYRMGAGLGPATAFLYSGPAINVLAIIMTARILGYEIGLARGIGAVVFSVIVGLLMQFIFRKEEVKKVEAAALMPEPEAGRPLYQTAIYFAAMIAVLVFANWARPDVDSGFWFQVWAIKWYLTSGAAALLGVSLVVWFGLKWWRAAVVAVPVLVLGLVLPDEPLIAFAAGSVVFAIVTATQEGDMRLWFDASWALTKQILPLLLIGVLVSGALLGRPGHEGLIPSEWVAQSLGGNSLQANALASVAGAFMYFATLTEVPIIQGLMGSGMGKGPALALLLAGPALSLPAMLVLRTVMGTKKTVAYVAIVIVLAMFAGWAYGALPD